MTSFKNNPYVHVMHSVRTDNRRRWNSFNTFGRRWMEEARVHSIPLHNYVYYWIQYSIWCCISLLLECFECRNKLGQRQPKRPKQLIKVQNNNNKKSDELWRQVLPRQTKFYFQQKIKLSGEINLFKYPILIHAIHLNTATGKIA